MSIIVSNLRSLRTSVIGNATKLCCCHVPKCAGSSLWKAVYDRTYSLTEKTIARKFLLDVYACQTASEVERADYPQLATALASYHLADRQHVFVKGHFHCPPPMVTQFSDDWNFLTILREPISRFVSAFVYDTYKNKTIFRNTLGIEEFLDSQRGYYEGKIYMYHFSNYFRNPERSDSAVACAKAEAFDTLSRFRLTGVVEDMAGWLAGFERAFGRRPIVATVNASPRPEAAERIFGDKGLMRRIEALCETDLEIYDRVRTSRFT